MTGLQNVRVHVAQLNSFVNRDRKTGEGLADSKVLLPAFSFITTLTVCANYCDAQSASGAALIALNDAVVRLVAPLGGVHHKLLFSVRGAVELALGLCAEATLPTLRLALAIGARLLAAAAPRSQPARCARCAEP